MWRESQPDAISLSVTESEFKNEWISVKLITKLIISFTWKRIKFSFAKRRTYTLTFNNFSQVISSNYTTFRGTAVAQLVEALRYKSEGRGFDSQWCHWNFSLT